MRGRAARRHPTHQSSTRWRWPQAHHEKIVQSRALQQYWRGIEDKRDRLALRTEQCDVLMRLSFILSLVSLTSYINLAPGHGDVAPSDILLAVWSGLSVLSASSQILILVATCWQYLSLLGLATQEAPVHEAPQPCPPAASLDTASSVQDLDHCWVLQFDQLYWRLLRLLSGTVPLTFACLLTLAHVKFYMSPPAAWTSAMASLGGIGVWLRSHEPLVMFLAMSSSSALPSRRQPQAQ